MAECARGAYRPRRPRGTPLYRLVEEHFERFEQVYPERYEERYGFFRPVIRETVYKYLGCGDLKLGFARVRCRDCGHEYLLAYSCKGRYFCTSCHTTRAVSFAEWLHSTVLWPVAHRQIVLTMASLYLLFAADPLVCPDCHNPMRIVALSRSCASCAPSSCTYCCGTKPGRPRPRQARYHAHRSKSSTCHGWSDIRRAARRWSVPTRGAAWLC